MKLFTACFWTHMTDLRSVSIARGTPNFYKGPRYEKLAPSWELIRAYKDGMPEDVYEAVYRGEVLSKLTPEIIRADLLEGTILLCWERDGFCHRHIVNSWLWENGIECEEVTFT
jgi:hypothetical protein